MNHPGNIRLSSLWIGVSLLMQSVRINERWNMETRRTENKSAWERNNYLLDIKWRPVQMKGQYRSNCNGFNFISIRSATRRNGVQQFGIRPGGNIYIKRSETAKQSRQKIWPHQTDCTGNIAKCIFLSLSLNCCCHDVWLEFCDETVFHMCPNALVTLFCHRLFDVVLQQWMCVQSLLSGPYVVSSN